MNKPNLDIRCEIRGDDDDEPAITASVVVTLDGARHVLPVATLSKFMSDKYPELFEQFKALATRATVLSLESMNIQVHGTQELEPGGRFQ